VAFLSNRALYVPTLGIADPSRAWLVVILLGLGAAAGLAARTRLLHTASIAFLLAGVLALVAWQPFDLDRPILRGFSYAGGGRLTAEFLALFVALSIYGSAFVAEIVRGGLLSVARGQIEAAHALGLPGWLIELKIRIPLGLRAILPALSNQHLFTMKLTSLGAAIGFSDLFAVTSIGINQTGQTIELLAIMVALYFVTNYVLAMAMHLLNASFALKTRS
jgi:general L-amino acid transport system permease protein